MHEDPPTQLTNLCHSVRKRSLKSNDLYEFLVPISCIHIVLWLSCECGDSSLEAHAVCMRASVPAMLFDKLSEQSSRGLVSPIAYGQLPIAPMFTWVVTLFQMFTHAPCWWNLAASVLPTANGQLPIASGMTRLVTLFHVLAEVRIAVVVLARS